MNQLSLEPWEVPSACLSPASGEADALIEAHWRGRRREFLMRVVRLRDVYGCTFIREKDSDATGNWLLAERFLPHDALEVWNAYSKPPLEEVAEGVESGDIELARFCVVPDGKQTRRALTVASGESVWLSVAMEGQEPFDLLLSEADFYRDGGAHFRALSEEVARPGSDARFAANWRHWPHEKKQRHIWGVKRLREMETVMRSALLCEWPLWGPSDHWVWILAAAPDMPSLPFADSPHSGGAKGQQVNFLELARLLMRLFEPPPDQNQLLAHRCVRDFTLWGISWPRVEVRAAPTHHERLEARLWLREWLQHNAPDRMDLLLD